MNFRRNYIINFVFCISLNLCLIKVINIIFLYAVTSVIKVNLFPKHIKANVESNIFMQPDFSGFLDILCKGVKKK